MLFCLYDSPNFCCQRGGTCHDRAPTPNHAGHRACEQADLDLCHSRHSSQVVNSMHNIVDQTFLGWGIGDLAIAATNSAFPLSTLTTALAALIGMGGAAGFSLDLGKKQARSARKNWGNAIVLSVGLGCLLAVLAVAFLEPMLYLFGATEAMMIYAVPYARIISMGLPFAIFSMAMAHFIRADGSPKFSSGVLLSGAIFNMIFDPIFLFACSMGIQGVALATVLGQGLSSCLAPIIWCAGATW